MVAELQRLHGTPRPNRWLRYGGRVVVRGAAGGIGLLSGHHLVSGDPCLSELAERDHLRAAEIGEVRIVLVPAAELVRFLAHADISFAPPRFGLAVVHAVADRPGYGDLAGKGFSAGFTPQRSGKDVAVIIGCSHAFLRAKKIPLSGGPTAAYGLNGPSRAAA